MPYESAADRAIREAMDRGAFDNLPGAGKPIKGLDGRHDENWWLKSFLEREKISMPLPGSLQLRKEVEVLPEALASVRRESQVREIVANLNERVRKHRLHPDGPPIMLPDVDAEAVVAQWKQRRHADGKGVF